MRVALRLGLFSLIATLAAAQAPMRVLLRTKGEVKTIHLGEPIAVEFACMVEPGREVETFCWPQVEIKPVSGGARVSLEQSRHDLLDEALTASYPIGVCGTVPSPGKLTFTAEPEWKSENIDAKFPVAAGLYEIHAQVSDANGATYEAQPVQLEVIGDPSWHDRLLQLPGCTTDSALGVLPDEPRALATLRAHLAECAKENDFALREAIEQIVWLELQTKAPEILNKIQQREMTYIPDKPMESEVQRWMRARYRSLLLETARQLVEQHRHRPKNEDLETDIEMAFTNWGEMMRNFTDFDHPLLTHGEIAAFLRAAGYSEEDVRMFFQ